MARPLGRALGRGLATPQDSIPGAPPKRAQLACFLQGERTLAKSPARAFRMLCAMSVLLTLSACLPLALASPPPSGAPSEPQESAGEVEPWRLDLNTARTLALRGNLDLRIAEESVQQAHFSYVGSFGAFEWRFRADATYTDAEREVTSSFISGGARIKSETNRLNFVFERPLQTGAIFDVSFNTNVEETNAAVVDDEKQTSDELAFSFTQPLLRGRGEAVATATQQEEEARWQKEVEVWRGTRQTTLGDVDLAYWDLRAAIDALEVQDSAVALGAALLERRQEELNAGVGTEIAVLESQADLATRREAQLAAANLVRQREDALKTLLLGAEDLELWERSILPVEPYPTLRKLGWAQVEPERADAQAPGAEGSEPDENVKSLDEASLPELPGWRQILAIALENRTELRQAQSDIRLAEIAKARALSDRLAGLDLVLRASSNSVDRSFRRSFADTLDWESPTYSAQLSYDLPIGNTQARSEAQRADSALRSAWIQWERVQRDVVADVRNAARELSFRREALLAADQSLNLSQRQLEQEEARNREGLSTNYQVLEVQQSYVEALSTQRAARAEWAKAWVGLERAKGTLQHLESGPAAPR